MEERRVVDAARLTRWQQLPPTQPSISQYTCARHKQTPFPLRPDVNASVAVWYGPLCDLNTACVVVPTNEKAAETSPVTRRLLERAGPEMAKELRQAGRRIHTGQARLTKGYNLPSRYVIHTSTPRYNERYRTAAEGTLHSCYREALQLMHDCRLSGVAIPSLHSTLRGFPPDKGAHIALRTVRRYLEQFATANTLIVLVPERMDAGIYDVLMPLYFPRDETEQEYARYQLPEDVGDEFGAPVIPDRAIRIIDNPQHNYQGLDSSGDHSLPPRLVAGLRAFAVMEDDIDKQRLLGTGPQAGDARAAVISQQLCKQERYERLLRRARTEDLSEVSGIGCLYQTGKDRLGRPVICFIGKWFNAAEINLDKALLYLIYLLEPLVVNDYTIVYFHTLTESENHPAMSWIRQVYDVLEYKYKKNLKAFYIVHPTIWTKLMTWWFTTFMAPGIKRKVHNITGVEYLYSMMDMNQLEIPAFITEYDMTINGIRYYRPQS